MEPGKNERTERHAHIRPQYRGNGWGVDSYYDDGQWASTHNFTTLEKAEAHAKKLRKVGLKEAGRGAYGCAECGAEVKPILCATCIERERG